jgi:regulator of RNase E activity RraA
MVVADDDGVIVIPQDMVSEFVQKARAWADKDQNARQDIKQGALLLDTLDKYGHL